MKEPEKAESFDKNGRIFSIREGPVEQKALDEFFDEKYLQLIRIGCTYSIIEKIIMI